MDPVPLTPALRAKVATLFPDRASEIEARLLADCGAELPMIDKQGIHGIQRVRCAVLKLSQGLPEKFDYALDRANGDWRDVLVWAGFGNNLNTHLDWLDEGS